MRKYRNKIVNFNHEKFDSRLELQRYLYLKALEDRDEIKNLRRQVRFELLPAQRNSGGKLIERSVCYIADFTYERARDGKFCVEDVKGMKTDVYKIKRKLLLFSRKIQIKEVTADESTWSIYG